VSPKKDDHSRIPGNPEESGKYPGQSTRAAIKRLHDAGSSVHGAIMAVLSLSDGRKEYISRTKIAPLLKKSCCRFMSDRFPRQSESTYKSSISFLKRKLPTEEAV